MMKNRLLCLAWLTLIGFVFEAIAQDDADCTRYRVAGSPCSVKFEVGVTRTPAVVPPPVRPGSLPKPVAPKATSRDASGAPLATPPSVRVLSAVVPASWTTVMTSAPPLAAPLTTPLVMPTTGRPITPLAATLGGRLAPLMGSAGPAPASTPSVTDNRETGQVIVYWSGIEEADAALVNLARDSRIQSLNSSKLDHLGGLIATFQLKTQAEASDFRDQLIRDFPGLAVDFNTRYRPLQQQTIPRIYLPAKIDRPPFISATTAWKELRIGIIDGPVMSIAALASSQLIRKSFLASTDIPASTEHATSIAALISGQDRAAGFWGVVPQASLYSAEIMRSTGQTDLTNTVALIRALDWLLSEKVQAINLSLGGSGDAVMARAFARLAELPVVAVAAAGNGGPGAKPVYPAAYPGVLAVTATDALDNAYNLANQGAYITLAAPGVDLWVPDAATGHYVNGTSFAAAVVTAASALLLAQLPQLNAKSLTRQLCRSAKDLGAKGLDPVFGCGLIQIGAALSDDR